MTFPRLSNDLIRSRLEPPRGRVRMVLDTDTYNEIDDQFALAYALCSGEKLAVEAVYAAPVTLRTTFAPMRRLPPAIELGGWLGTGA